MQHSTILHTHTHTHTHTRPSSGSLTLSFLMNTSALNAN
jgi:hypothetical protein